MRVQPVLIGLFAILFFSSCHNKWNDETKGAFSKTCEQNYTKDVCDCALDLFVEQYPDGKLPADSLVVPEIKRVAKECGADAGKVKPEAASSKEGS